MLIDVSNKACKNITANYLKVGYDTMKTIRLRTIAKGDLPRLSYILRKPDPPEKEFNTVAFYVTGVLIYIELHKIKEGTKNRKYHLKLDATGSCTNRIVEAIKRIVQRCRKGFTNDCFHFDSRFSSKKSTEYVMKVGDDLIVMVKTTRKRILQGDH